MLEMSIPVQICLSLRYSTSLVTHGKNQILLIFSHTNQKTQNYHIFSRIKEETVLPACFGNLSW